MPDKKRRPVPNNQLRLIDTEPEPSREKPQEKKPREKKPRVPKRIDRVEDRVTHLEADLTLIRSQLDREEDYEEEEDDEEEDAVDD